uniref:S-adenosylmethionine decarboxylase proenzyme n=2 Tax=Paulinella micropora TaxID=1928728 RepID=A0A1L5YCD9_9EUKA|nr:S-adenosylmethionine decarboxylase proenzyme [Paulinella micropora]AQX45138.1 S-adenosylmethionine decarboxylase proenzyme [Paulinella micropora]
MILLTLMKETLSCLHPNPGWDTSTNYEVPNPSSSPTEMVGKHCILELYDCDVFKLNDESFLRNIITGAAKSAGATLLNLITHRFEPQGVTGLALLAESHISIHTWPESGYAAVDVFTCGDHTMPEEACNILRNALGAKHHALKSFRREAPRTIVNSPRDPYISVF